MYRRNHLSVYCLYCNDEQDLFSMYCLCRWNTEKCYMYSNGEHGMYRMRSGVHIQYNNKCCDLYCLYIVCCWNKEKCYLYSNR